MQEQYAQFETFLKERKLSDAVKFAERIFQSGLDEELKLRVVETLYNWWQEFQTTLFIFPMMEHIFRKNPPFNPYILKSFFVDHVSFLYQLFIRKLEAQTYSKALSIAQELLYYDYPKEIQQQTIGTLEQLRTSIEVIQDSSWLTRILENIEKK